MAVFRIGTKGNQNHPWRAGWAGTACLLALGLFAPQLPAEDLKFQVSSVPNLTCASSNATVGQIILTKLAGPSEIGAGTEITLVFNYPVAAAPTVSVGDFSKSVSRESVRLTLNRDLRLVSGGTLTLSGTRLNLQGQFPAQVFANVQVRYFCCTPYVGYSGVGRYRYDVVLVGPNPLPVARTGLFEIYPTSLTFTAAPDGPGPGFQTLGVNAQGDWTAVASPSWLRVSPASGSGPRSLSVSVNPAGLALGTHRGSIMV